MEQGPPSRREVRQQFFQTERLARLDAEESRMFGFRDSIVLRGARTANGIFSIPPLGAESSLSGSSNPLPVYESTLRWSVYESLRHVVYGAAKDRSTLVVTRYLAERNFPESGIATISNLPIGNQGDDNSLHENVSIFLNEDDELLPIRKVDVIIYTQRKNIDYGVLFDVASRYDMVVTEFSFNDDAFSNLAGVARCVIETGMADIEPTYFKPSASQIQQAMNTPNYLTQKLQQYTATKQRLLS